MWSGRCLGSVIAPINNGRILTPTTVAPYLGSQYPYTTNGWEAQLAIVQGDAGGFYVRNTDDTFQFKRFAYARGGGSVTVMEWLM